ncbi:MAG TPA: hypothetical protein VK508_03620 [Cyclobacteriaceae bacterium]|nr:hypothetical protein [Cyclobacteriaceae bacterium]
MSALSPIVLFVYNRPRHTLQTLTALSANTLASQSILYIYSDGPANDSPGLAENIAKTRQIIRDRPWCKEVIIKESDFNKGLAASITQGVTEVIRKHGRVIVLEDDIVTSPGFLQYMNDALECWKDEEQVMHISGHMYRLNIPMPETVFLNVVTPWGWGTWDRAWRYFVDDAKLLLNKLHNFKGFSQETYNRGYGQEFYKQITANADGSMRTWAVKWHTVIYLMNGACLHPGGSLTENIGFDGSGENSGKDTAYRITELRQSVKVEKIEIQERPDVLKAFAEHYAWFASKGIPHTSLLTKGINFLKRVRLTLLPK